MISVVEVQEPFHGRDPSIRLIGTSLAIDMY